VLRNRGFTLIEALFTAVIVASGLVTVATIFSFAIQANINNRQMAVATSLVYDKMEELKWAAWPSDGSDQFNQNGTYSRTWRISGTNPRTVTVTVYARQTELVEATTMISPTF
jgi:type II secretory pathway pseudopilin PulG